MAAGGWSRGWWKDQLECSCKGPKRMAWQSGRVPQWEGSPVASSLCWMVQREAILASLDFWFFLICPEPSVLCLPCFQGLRNHTWMFWASRKTFFFLKNSSTDEPLKLPGVNCGLPHGGKGSGSQSAWYQKGLEREKNGGGHSLSSACFQSICSCAEFSLLFYPFRNSDIDSCQHRAGFHLLQERVQAVNLVICPEQQSIWVAFSFLEVCLPKQSLYMSPCTPVLLGLLI